MSRYKLLESFIRRIVKEEKLRLGEGNDSLLDYVLQQMSSGTVASFTGVQDYKTIDRIKQKMVDILQKTGDQQYSISAAKKLANKALSSLNESQKLKFRRKF